MCRRLDALVLLAFVAACEPGSHNLTLDVRSDLMPGVDVIEVRVTLTQGGSTVRTQLTPIGVDAPLIDAVRVAEFLDVPSGDYELEAIGRGPSGSVRREGIVELRASEALLYTLPSACVGVVCPPSDDPTATDCDEGMCVAPPCAGECTGRDAAADTTPPADSSIDTSPPADTSVPVDTSAPIYPCPGVVDYVRVSEVGIGASIRYAERNFTAPPAIVLTSAGGDAAFGYLSQTANLAPGLAHAKSAPLIFTPGGSLRPDVREYLLANRGSVTEVFLVGGEGELTPALESAIAGLHGWTVTRFGGGGWADTARRIANQIGTGDGRVVILRANDGSLNDAAVAVAAAAVRRRPVLYVNGGGIPMETANWLSNHTSVTGADVIADEARLRTSTVDMLGLPYVRYASADDFAEAIAIADAMAPDATRAGLVGVSSRLLALSIGARGIPVLLVDTASLPSSTADYLRTSPIAGVDLMGPLTAGDAIEMDLCALFLAP
jgi:hypothetical protein